MKNTEKLREFRESRRLWPDPFDAPDVPPRRVLRAFLREPGSLEAGLADQIRESVNCRRALERVALEDGVHPWSGLVSGGAESGVGDSARLRLPPPRPLPPPVKLPGPGKVEPAAGQLWLTGSAFEVFLKPSIVRRRTFLPQTVILVEPGLDVGYDTLFRAVPVSPLSLWPREWVADDEIVLDIPRLGEHAVHLWLECPVSIGQLEGFRGRLPTRAAGRLSSARIAVAGGRAAPLEAGGGRPLDPGPDADVMAGRDRLQDIASYLSATADARLARASWEGDIQALDEAIKQILELEPSTAVSCSTTIGVAASIGSIPLPAAARDRLGPTRVIRIRPGESVALGLEQALKEGQTGLARLESEPVKKTDGTVGCIWKLEDSLGALPPKSFFLVYDIVRKKRIGWGEISERYASVRSGDIKDFKAVGRKPGRFLLVVISNG